MPFKFSTIQTNVLPGLLFLLIFFETALHTFWRNAMGPFTSPIVLMIISLFIGIVYLFLFYNRNDGRQAIDGRITVRLLERKSYWWLWLIFVIGIAGSAWMLSDLFRLMPIDIRLSDIIPVTMRYVENFVNGNEVYQTMQFDGYERYPKYFPLRWFPMVVPYLLKFDPRWMAFGILVIAMIINQARIIRIETETPCLLVKSVFPLLCLASFVWFDQAALAFSLESMNAGYYLLFGLSLFAVSPLMRSGGLLTVLLSRFSILLWIPLYAVIYFFENRKKMLVTSGLVLVGMFFLFFLPFLPFEAAFFKDLLGKYAGHASSELNAWTWQEIVNGKPAKLFKGVGMASQFYANESITVAERLQLLKKTHLWLSVAVVLVMGIIYFPVRKKIGMNHFLLASAKLYLVIFYSFIYVPYTYLYMVPVFFSFVILSNINFPHFKFVKS